jgi:hypothetical protein
MNTTKNLAAGRAALPAHARRAACDSADARRAAARPQVKSIAEMGAYVSLLEYNNIEGMILLSELSRRRIRSVTKLIKARGVAAARHSPLRCRIGHAGGVLSRRCARACAPALTLFSSARRGCARAGGADRARDGAARGQGEGLH